MAGTPKTEILDYGVRVLRSRHREIRRLKRVHNPSFQGFRVWSSSWLMMDFFKRQGLQNGTRVMEVGCGWGLAGIYCAKKHGAVVTGVDIDSAVFPYLNIHTKINDVKIATMRKGFDGLIGDDLKDIDVIIGADICFWDSMVDSLKRLICRALGEGVRLVVIADPGRSSFDKLGGYFVEKLTGKMLNRTVRSPYLIKGRILKIDSPGRDNRSPLSEIPVVEQHRSALGGGNGHVVSDL